MKALPKQYDHKEAEKRWQDHWVASGTYHFQDDLPREQTFVIDTPPPTVSGLLHMGHIFSYTQADFVARYQRMAGKDVFYPMGFDDNGLPTERLVEKSKKVQAHRYIAEKGRAAFVELCREVVVDAEEEFRKLFKSAALSVDWRQEYQTISDEVRALSQQSFVELLHDGQAYRKLQPMLWDPVDQTAIAQAEIEDKELPSHFNDIHFGVEGSYDKVTIGTTRPELIGACVAVFYHPDDDRYTHLKNRMAVTPLFGAKVPFLADENVKMDKGTGLVMCCTFGDETDIMWWRTHNLDTRVILNKYGKLEFSSEVVEHYTLHDENLVEELKGKKCTNPDKNNPGAREITLEKLKAHNLLVKQEPITHAVKCAERSGAPLEIIPTYQWFINVLDHREALKKKAGEATWYPEYMKLRLEQWADGLSWDWCISRQRFFGVPFPVWYVTHPDGNVERVCAEIEDLPVDPMADLPKGYTKVSDMVDEKSGVQVGWVAKGPDGKEVSVIPDTDVMDTWATSSITPQISAKSLVPNKLYPADVRPQAHEIIRSWAFYTMVKSHLHADCLPWKNLMISGWCLASDKTKMSKSKGNVVTPVALIEEKGTDAVRYWASTSRLGSDTAFSEDLLKIGRKLVTKLWNASNFVGIQLEGLKEKPAATAADDVAKGHITEALDKWVLTRLHRAVKKATQEFEQFEYCDARVAVEDFFWNDFCDNYLELVKARAYGENVDKKAQQSALLTLYHCLEAVLRLFAPIVPHVTEEIYSHLFDDAYKKAGSLHARGMWPNAAEYPACEAEEKTGFAVLEVLELIRKAKSEAGVSIKYPVERVEVFALPEGPGFAALNLGADDLKAAGSVETFEEGKAESGALSEGGHYRVAVTLAPESSAQAAG